MSFATWRVGSFLRHFRCKESARTRGYLTFCKIVNSVLAKTKTQEVGGFLKRNSLDILLHNTSELQIPALHAGQYSIRIPDCTFLPRAIARRYHDEDTHKYIEWDTPLGVVGIKSGRSHKPKIPALYVGTELADDTREDYVNRADSRNTKEGSSISQSPHEASIGGSHSASKRKAMDEAGPHPEKMIKTDSGRGVSSPYPESESGTRSIESELISEVQFGGYNAEMLSAATVIRKHTIGMMYKANRVEFWWFDRQCPIRSPPLNIIADLPRFVVFLRILQRLTREGWGYVPIMHPPDSSNSFGIQQPSTQPAPDEVAGKDAGKMAPRAPAVIICGKDTYHTPDAFSRVHHIWGLNGRKTTVRRMTRIADNKQAVVKVAWQKEVRTSEKVIYDFIKQVAEDDPVVKEHVSELLDEQIFTDYNTGTFRKHAGIPITKEKRTGYRVLRVTVFVELDGCITELRGEDFWRAFLDCLECHYKLWLAGVFHRDISANNLMYKIGEGGKIRGVLIDFDLAKLRGDATTSTEPTGTLPFMALEMLETVTTKTFRPHLYRHDVESFLWVVIWVCAHYVKGNERVDAPFKRWAQRDARNCLTRKLAFLFTPLLGLWSTDHEADVGLLQSIVNHLRSERLRQLNEQAWSVEPTPMPEELDDDEATRRYYKEITEGLFLEKLAERKHDLFSKGVSNPP
ncbi:hypothetical protein M408DRAFT_115928 [Serendipita vermifera MAFF 305830]|uniref:Protein kinase domain-containing protein n=1 Tax=Serendipita vermifera MAFF 305830 TaxID=933852 RepID=A0A0C3BBX0_SERVB|nr:hypothetical protein M408DRAFT_115928 [Serendipita vermifera MAFF 305830]